MDDTTCHVLDNTFISTSLCEILKSTKHATINTIYIERNKDRDCSENHTNNHKAFYMNEQYENSTILSK